MKLGDRVQLQDKPRAGTAIIISFYRDIRGGVRLSRALDGFYSWNVADLIKARKARAAKRKDANG